MAESDPSYTSLCDALKAMAQGEYKALTEGRPELDTGAVLGNQDLSQDELSGALSRDSINEQYLKKMNGGGVSPQEIHAAQMQATILSAMEKAARLKHRSRVVSLVWGASRPYGQSLDTGYFGHVLPTIPIQQGA